MYWRQIPAAAMLLAVAAPSAAQSIDTLSLRAHTRFLAHDSLLGRGTGTKGERIAAAYIAAQLQQLGLKPLGPAGSFLHPIPLRAARLESDSRISVVGMADSASFEIGNGFVVNAAGHGALRDFRGRAVLLGLPEHARRLITAERSLVDRVAVFLGPLGAHARELIPALSHAGAAGVIVLVDEEPMYDLYVRSRGDTRYFVDAPVDDPIWQPPLPVIMAGPALSLALVRDVRVPEALLVGSATQPLDLGRTVAARIRATLESVPAANVAAVLPGSDPVLRDEYVVYTAHYDHLGVSVPDQNGDSIYNGFSDNAAGVAMLLAIAEALRPQPPPRSVMFLFFTGEERGLLGSSYFAATSPVPTERMAGLINLDAGAPPVPPVSWRIAGGTDTPLGQRAQQLASARGWTASLSPASPNSDYWPFLQRGVPAIFIIPGDQWENTSPAERDALRRRWDRYHRADDHWHADFPFAGLRRYAEFALLLGLQLAGSR
jgi:hypothetical protein